MRARAHPVRGTGGQHARGAVRVRTATRTSTCDASGTRCGRAPTTCNRHDNLCDVASHSFVRLSLPAHRYITPCPHESPPRMPPWRPSHHACSALTPALPAVPCLLTMQRAPHVCMPVDAHMFHALLYAHDRCGPPLLLRWGWIHTEPHDESLRAAECSWIDLLGLVTRLQSDHGTAIHAIAGQRSPLRG